MAKKKTKTTRKTIYIPDDILNAINLSSELCVKDPNDYIIDILRSWHVQERKHPIMGILNQLAEMNVKSLNEKDLLIAIKKADKTKNSKRPHKINS